MVIGLEVVEETTFKTVTQVAMKAGLMITAASTMANTMVIIESHTGRSFSRAAMITPKALGPITAKEAAMVT